MHSHCSHCGYRKIINRRKELPKGMGGTKLNTDFPFGSHERMIKPKTRYKQHYSYEII